MRRCMWVCNYKECGNREVIIVFHHVIRFVHDALKYDCMYKIMIFN